MEIDNLTPILPDHIQLEIDSAARYAVEHSTNRPYQVGFVAEHLATELHKIGITLPLPLRLDMARKALDNIQAPTGVLYEYRIFTGTRLRVPSVKAASVDAPIIQNYVQQLRNCSPCEPILVVKVVTQDITTYVSRLSPEGDCRGCCIDSCEV